MFDGQLYQEPEVVRDLRETRKVIERGWTREVQARDSAGWPVFADDLSAVRFCLGGAVMKATGSRWGQGSATAPMKLLDEIVGPAPSGLPRYGGGAFVGGALAYFNNEVAKDVGDILALIDKAIDVALVKEAVHV